MSENTFGSGASSDALDPFRQAYDLFIAKYDGAGQSSGYSTGFTDLDQRLGGLQKGELILVTGEPSSGKTTFASNIVCHVAITGNIPVVFYTFEMRAFKLAWRMLLATGRIHSSAINAGKPLDDDWSRLTMAIRLLCSDRNMQIVDSIQTIAAVIASVRSCSKGRNPRLVVIDYLQLAAEFAETKDDSYTAEKIFAQLKILAVEQDIQIILIADKSSLFPGEAPYVDLHLNLKLENSKGNCDEVCVTRVEILKSRNTGTGFCELLFLKPYFRFADLDSGSIQGVG